MEDKNIEIILFWETGVWKSSLGNFLLCREVFKNNHGKPKTIELGRNNYITIIKTLRCLNYNYDN